MTEITYPTQFLNVGIAIIPVKFRDKRPDASQLPKDADGSPTWDLFKTTLPSPDDLRRWFAKPNNYGVVAGWRGLVILDFDDAGEYGKWRLWASRVGGQPRFIAENAFQVTTSRGVHVYLRSDTPGANRKAGKIDIKYRGYVLGPGSIHPTGVEYRALKSALVFPLIHSLSDVLPGEILTLATPENVKTHVTVVADPWTSAMRTPTILSTGIVDKIKATLRIEDTFIQKSQTSADGRWFITRCPLHDDHKPSFWIDTEHQICGCFAQCYGNKPLDVIGLHARMYGLSNSEAIRVLAVMAG